MPLHRDPELGQAAPEAPWLAWQRQGDDAPHRDRGRGSYPRLEAHVDLLNLFLFRNDADFDRTKSAYDRTGQSVGAFATVFRPKLTFHIARNLRLYYEAELGLNFWSKNNPDQQFAPMGDALVLKHREVYSEGEFLHGRAGFKVGYQHFRDTTGLFVAHWIGAANVWYAFAPDVRASMFVAQIPDQTYEGLNANDPTVLHNNFNNDIFVFGPRADIKLGEKTDFAAAVHVLYDAHTIGQRRWLMAPNMQIGAKVGRYEGFLGAVLQTGKHENAGLGGKDQNIFAWAAQAHGEVKVRPFGIALNLLALSPDDQAEGNNRNGAFLYSSKSRSATIILTEDELRNWYDQLDRRMGRYEGGFWAHRAGLFVGDVKGQWMVTRIFRPSIVLGAGSVLNKKNSMDKAFVGVETDLNLEFHASEHLIGNLVGGILIPGGAAAALTNKVNLGATDPIWMIEAGLMARY
jgi:hypothetical protein